MGMNNKCARWGCHVDVPKSGRIAVAKQNLSSLSIVGRTLKEIKYALCCENGCSGESHVITCYCGISPPALSSSSHLYIFASDLYILLRTYYEQIWVVQWESQGKSLGNPHCTHYAKTDPSTASTIKLARANELRSLK